MSGERVRQQPGATALPSQPIRDMPTTLIAIFILLASTDTKDALPCSQYFFGTSKRYANHADSPSNFYSTRKYRYIGCSALLTVFLRDWQRRPPPQLRTYPHEGFVASDVMWGNVLYRIATCRAEEQPCSI